MRSQLVTHIKTYQIYNFVIYFDLKWDKEIAKFSKDWKQVQVPSFAHPGSLVCREPSYTALLPQLDLYVQFYPTPRGEVRILEPPFYLYISLF